MSTTKRRQQVVLATILTCQLMVVLDGTIVTIALPEIRQGLHFSAPNLSWVVNAYTLTFGGLLLLGARAGDILGRRITFMIGVGLFTIASVTGGFAQSSAELLASRAAQGVGGALASPSALALLMTMYAEGRERTRAIGYYTAVSVGGSAVGMVAGGLLTQYASWRWVFFVNIPIGAAVVASTYRFVVETERHTGRFDVAGALTSTGGMAALAYGFVHAATASWTTPATLVAFAAGVTLIATFIIVESRAESPITPLRLFANRNRSTSYVARLLLVAGSMGMFFFLTQFLQEVLGYSPLDTGLAFLPVTAALFVMSQVSARYLIEWIGSRPLMLIGIAISMLGLLWLTQISETSGYGAVVGPLMALGVGNGLAFIPLTNVALSGVAQRDAGAASGMVNVMQQVGGSLGLAVLVTVFGEASRHATRHPPRGVTGAAIAKHALTAGSDRAFQLSALFIALNLVLVAIFLRRPAEPQQMSSDEEFTDDLGVVGSLSATASG